MLSACRLCQLLTLVCCSLRRYANEEQKNEIFSSFSKGEKIGAFVCPDQAGSDAIA
jgi:Pyruvate/2-oxoacid:ferredoxin oxidoreductase delta subunit